MGHPYSAGVDTIILAGLGEAFILANMAQRPVQQKVPATFAASLFADLTQEFVLSSLARRPLPQSVPATFAASLLETLTILQTTMIPGDMHIFLLAPPVKTDSFEQVVELPFDREWIYVRDDTRLKTSDILKVRVFQEAGSYGIHTSVVINHMSHAFGPHKENNISLAFQKSVPYNEYTSLVMGEKRLLRLQDEIAAPVPCIKVVDDDVSLLCEQLAVTRIKHRVSWPDGDDIISFPYDTVISFPFANPAPRSIDGTKLLDEVKHTPSKRVKSKTRTDLLKIKRPARLNWRASPQVEPDLLKI
jgi:hypothetical protein